MTDLLVELLDQTHREAERAFVLERSRWSSGERKDYPNREDGIAEGVARALVVVGRGVTEDLRFSAQVAALADLEASIGPREACRAKLRR